MRRTREAILGELSILLGTAINVNSTGKGGDCQTLIYDTWKLDKRFKKAVKGRDEDEDGFVADPDGDLTSDDAALLSLYLKNRDPRLKLVLRMRAIVKEMSYLKTQTDSDGRVRPGLNLVATPTGRMAAYKSPTGTSKLNLQTITKRLRKLFKADPGCIMKQRDLGGADGWTVAAHCASLGDRTMLEDFLAKLKPQSILALIYKQGPSANRLSRDELKAHIKAHVDESSWQYMAFKRVFHLSDYAGMPKQMSKSILSDSWKKGGDPIFIDAKTCEDMQKNAFHVRYVGVRRWHDVWEKKLAAGQEVAIVTSYGHKHVFNGRKREWNRAHCRYRAYPETHRYMLACEPQKNTTHVLKRAMFRLWYDSANRRPDGSLIVEPLMPVHDSLLVQCREEDEAWAEQKMISWYHNPVRIAGVEVLIPSSSETGHDWGMK